ncbi:hypothetical protein PENTCL1PPCAC_1768, partial [Pristionchus entomophagus]
SQDKIDRCKEGRRERKEKEKRKKEKNEKKREPEPARGSTESSALTTTTATTGEVGYQGSQPKSDVLEETSAMAQPEDPDEVIAWEYEDAVDKKPSAGQKIKDIVDKSADVSNRSAKRADKMASRPIKESTLDRFMEKVKARQESRVRSGEKIARESECVFPDAVDAVR